MRRLELAYRINSTPILKSGSFAQFFSAVRMLRPWASAASEQGVTLSPP